MARQLRPHLRAWIGLGLGLAALILAARAVDFSQVMAVLRGVRLPFVLLTLLSSLLTPVMKAARWRWLFYPQRPAASLGRLAGLIVIGQAVNFFIPGRLGELVRAYLTGEELGISKMYALGTLAAEKLLDLVILAVLFVALLPSLALPDWLAARVEPVLVTALLVAIGAVALLGGRRAWLRLAEIPLRLLPAGQRPRWRARIAAGLDGLAALGNPRAALGVWGWSLLFWAVSALTNGLLFLAFDLPPSPLMALFVLAVLQGGVAAPSTPGKIGVFHYLCILALSVFGVDAAAGLGYGLVLHLLVVGSIAGWAALALWSRSLSWGALTRATADIE